MKQLVEFRNAQAEVEKKNEKQMSHKMFNVGLYEIFMPLWLMAGALFLWKKAEFVDIMAMIDMSSKGVIKKCI
jgi:hypothetical protein